MTLSNFESVIFSYIEKRRRFVKKQSPFGVFFVIY